MNSKQLNDELTIIGLILVVLFVLYTAHGYSSKILEAQKAVIYLDKKLTKAEVQLNLTNAALAQNQSELHKLSDNLSKLQHLDKVKKDIDRNLWPDK